MTIDNWLFNLKLQICFVQYFWKKITGRKIAHFPIIFNFFVIKKIVNFTEIPGFDKNYKNLFQSFLTVFKIWWKTLTTDGGESEEVEELFPQLKQMEASRSTGVVKTLFCSFPSFREDAQCHVCPNAARRSHGLLWGRRAAAAAAHLDGQSDRGICWCGLPLGKEAATLQPAGKAHRQTSAHLTVSGASVLQCWQLYGLGILGNPGRRHCWPWKQDWLHPEPLVAFRYNLSKKTTPEKKILIGWWVIKDF